MKKLKVYHIPLQYPNSGSEANETAFKIARQYHHQRGEASRHKIISRYRSYHGNTLATLAATGQVKQLQEEQHVTVLYTSHYMEEVEALCDRVYIMDQGDVIASGTIRELKAILSSEQTVELTLAQPNHHLLELLMEDSSIKVSQKSDFTYSLIAPHTKNIFQTVIELANTIGIQINAIQVRTPTLEDVFLHLTGRTLRD